MNFFVAYLATLAAKSERLIIFRYVIGKKRVAKKNVITTDGVNRIPTTSLHVICGLGLLKSKILGTSMN